jgi:hypothetical protein
MTSSTVGEIAEAFQDEGFAPNPDCTYEDSSSRRTTTQSYLEAVNWADPNHVRRALRVFQRLLDGRQGDESEKFWRSLRRDGFVQDEATGLITHLGPQLSIGSLAGLRDATAIREQLARIQRALDDDPALAVGSAKELPPRWFSSSAGCPPAIETTFPG